MIIIIFGLPGTGKTTIAETLAEKINGKVISSDKVRKDLELEGDYSEEAKELVYNAMITNARREEGKYIVLDATFNKDKYRHLLERQFDNNDLFYVEVTAPEKIIKQRMKKNRKYSEADFDTYLKLMNEFESLKEDHLVINTQEDTEIVVRRIVEALKYSGSNTL